MLQIVDGRRNFGASHADAMRHPAYARVAQMLGVKIPDQSVVADLPPLKARLNRNRWIVDCPDCQGADFVWTDDREPKQMCGSCFNVAVGHKWRRVELPTNRAQIEAVLKARPIPQNRNWQFGEKLTAMKKENREHGLPEEVL